FVPNLVADRPYESNIPEQYEHNFVYIFSNAGFISLLTKIVIHCFYYGKIDFSGFFQRIQPILTLRSPSA
ncbi:hypothetical protein, partial [Pseudomonas aeruginosa]|uniref:hypothetical protein n=1 Tax=Pseudomonas aeruginosa TaxID=287 RepID=UPI001D0A6361